MQAPYHFEAMSNNQRKIIHELVKKIDGIVSYSLGAGQERHVVIKSENLEQP
ncbi:R3H domain-containing nucleic acid-binding protein [Spiroplasma endosymbiont of Nebria brevicollis]|uniref:R3H domain-containing nucleic acid-binding protein n=1 Tax=Spiroplasma endosymbiont of Nebria brevicollis TaxID=3066284 RepID=UPI00313CE694